MGRLPGPPSPAGATSASDLIVRRDDRGIFDEEEAEAIDDLIGSCQLSDVCLRSVIVVSDEGRRAVHDVAIAGFGGNNGHQ